jgi:hypothetical protein
LLKIIDELMLRIKIKCKSMIDIFIFNLTETKVK